MNKLYCLIIMFFTCEVGIGQNLVPNPSFENYNNCPVGFGELYACVDWSTCGNSPDYFHVCSPDTFVSTPNNNYGFQYPASGNAYSGFLNVLSLNAYREYLGAQLIQPLASGQKYYASIKVSLNNWLCPSNKMGIRFSTVIFDSLSIPVQNNIAHIFTDSVITDTSGWYQINGSFIADSNYTYIIIGNFFNNTYANCLPLTFSSYYYIDDVCVSTDSLTCNSTVGITETKNEDELILFPNPFSGKLNITVKSNGLVEVNLYDVTSRKLFNQSFTNSTSINTEQLGKGIYLYDVRNKNRVIKQGKVMKY